MYLTIGAALTILPDWTRIPQQKYDDVICISIIVLVFYSIELYMTF